MVRGFVPELNVGCGRKTEDRVNSGVLGLSNWMDEFPLNSAENSLEGQVSGKMGNSVLYLFNLNCVWGIRMEILICWIYGSGAQGRYLGWRYSLSPCI